MIEVRGNLWTYPADIRVITTNGTVKKNGECVMGRGCALEAKKKWNSLPLQLGLAIKHHGNIVQQFQCYAPDVVLFSFPVKHNWYEKADLELIRRSAQQLVVEIGKIPTDNPKLLEELRIVIPRPGCGNGGLKWEDVKPILEPILDDRFHIITF